MEYQTIIDVVDKYIKGIEDEKRQLKEELVRLIIENNKLKKQVEADNVS